MPHDVLPELNTEHMSPAVIVYFSTSAAMFKDLRLTMDENQKKYRSVPLYLQFIYTRTNGVIHAILYIWSIDKYGDFYIEIPYELPKLNPSRTFNKQYLTGDKQTVELTLDDKSMIPLVLVSFKLSGTWKSKD